MAIYDENVGLENFMSRPDRIAHRLSACHTPEATHQPAAPTASSPVPEPMQVDSTRLSPSERARRLEASVLNGPLHCPVQPKRPAVSTLQFETEISKLSMLLVQLLTPDHSITVPALVNLGFSGKFISQDLLNVFICLAHGVPGVQS